MIYGKLVTCTVFEDHPHQVLCHDNLIQSCNMGVDELPVVVDLASQVRVGSIRRLQDDLNRPFSYRRLLDSSTKGSTHLGAIREFMGGQVDLAEGAFADQAAKGIIANRLEIGARKLAAEVASQ